MLISAPSGSFLLIVAPKSLTKSPASFNLPRLESIRLPIASILLPIESTRVDNVSVIPSIFVSLQPDLLINHHAAINTMRMGINHFSNPPPDFGS
ncbi:hypothetical protein D3C80_1905400 [compost metagenome]